jgi:hypothetical protein
LDVKEADRLLDWAQATIATSGKPRSTKDLRWEVRQSRARLRGASWSPTVQTELETKNLKKAKHSAQPSPASGIRTATVKQLIDALVVRATGKADSEIALIVCEVTERLNELKANKQQRICEAKGGEREDNRTKGTSEKQKASRKK